MKKFALLCFLLCTAFLGASIRPLPGHLTLDAELLYWLPLLDESYYTIHQKSFPPNTLLSGHRIDHKLSWQAAYRLEAIWAFFNGSDELRLDWTHFVTHKNNKRIEDAGLLWATQGFPEGISSPGGQTFDGKTNSHIDLNYDAIDLLIGHAFLTHCPFNLLVQGGLQYAHFNVKEEIHYDEGSNALFFDIRNRGCVWGIGPECGLDFRYNLASILFCWCPPSINLTGRMHGALLISESEASFYQKELVSSTIDADVHNDDKWRLIPMWNLRLGLSYECSFCGCDTSLEVGYEAVSYLNALQSIRFLDSTDVGASLDLYSNLDFQGPYVNFAFTF